MAGENDRLREQQEFNRAGSEGVGFLKEMRDYMRQMSEFQALNASEQRRINQLTSDATRLAKELEGFSRDDLKNARKREKFQQTFNKAKQEQAGIQSEIVNLLKDDEVGRKRVAKILGDQLTTSEDLTSEAEKLNKEMKKTEKITGFFQGFENVVKDIPVVRNLFKELTLGSQAAAENFAEFGSKSKAVGAGLAKVGSGLLSVLSSTLVLAFVDGLGKANKASVAFTNQLTIGNTASLKLLNSLQQYKSATITLSQLKDSSVQFTRALGAAVPPSAENIKQFAVLNQRLGISADSAASLYQFSASTGKNFKDATDDIVGLTKSFNLTSDVTLNYSDILNDVANASKATLLTTNKFPGGIAKAAIQARRFGLSLANLEASSGALLNFQTSIESELEAELLTGKQLNLNRAREAALMGDQATLAREIAKNVGSAAEFGRMNVLQQEAVAKAVGMTREELAKSLTQRDALLKLEKESGIANLSRLDTQEQIDALMEKGMSEVQALDALGKTEVARQEETLTTQQALINAMETVGDELANLFTVITGLEDPLKSISNALIKMTGTVTKEENRGTLAKTIGGLLGIKGSKALGLGGAIAGKGGKLSTKVLGTGMAGKLGTKLGKSAIGKAIPGLALGFALTDLLEGDTVGAGINTVAGIASFFPGIGTAAAGALGALDIARELTTSGGTVDAEDFTIRTHPKDTLVMAGGTKFGEETNILLKELIVAVKEGKTINLDGRKLNEGLDLSYSKFS